MGFGPAREELEAAAGDGVLFTGALEHRHLRHLWPLADVSVTPSVFPEAFGMVAATGLSGRLLGRPYHHARLAQELLAFRRSRTRLLVFEPTPADQRAMGFNAMDTAAMAGIAAQAEASASAMLADAALDAFAA